MALSIGFRIISFLPSCYSSYGALDSYPGGTLTHCSCQPSLDAHLSFLIDNSSVRVGDHRQRSREPTIEQAVVYNFTWQLTSVSAQRRHSGPHLAAFQIGLYFVPCAPHRSHLLPRSQRKLVVDVFRTRLGPIAVAQQRFRVDRRREFDHGIKRVTATDRRLAIDKRTEIGSTNRTHR